jgi:malonyl-CoA O-methyltransferase
MAGALTLDKQAIRRRFERAAATYDEHSRLQRRMAERLLASIARRPLSILELGCGTGYLTSLLRERFPQAAIEAVDFSPAMIARARERVPNVSFLAADIEELEPEPEWYDLIVSNASVQWLSEPEGTLARLAESLEKKGQVCLTTFGPGTFRELDQVLAELGHERGLRMLSLQEWETLLAGAGLHRIRARSCEERLSYPDCGAFFRSVKSSGAGYAPHPLDPGTLKETIRRYDALFPDGSGVFASYEVITLSARR